MSSPKHRARRPLQIVAVALIGAMTTGCYTTTMISPLEVPRLAVNHGAVTGVPHPVRDLSGEVVTIGDDFSLQIDPRPGLPPEWARWRETAPPIKSPFAAELRGPLLVLQGAKDPNVIAVPLGYVQQVRVREYSHGKTAGLAIGATLGGLTVIAGITFIVIASALGNIR